MGHFFWEYQIGSQMSNMDIEGMRDYLNTLNTMQIVWLRGKISDKKASLIWQNLPVPQDLLIALYLLREQDYYRYELIRIIQMAVPEAMAKIRK